MIGALFKCIRKAGPELTVEKCHFGVTQVEFLGGVTTDGLVVTSSRHIHDTMQDMELYSRKRS